jgi:hypothetical protein
VAGGSTAGFRFRWEEQFPFVGGKGCIRGVPSKLAWCILGAYIRLFIRFGGYWKFVLDTPPKARKSVRRSSSLRAQARLVGISLRRHHSYLHPRHIIYTLSLKLFYCQRCLIYIPSG